MAGHVREMMHAHWRPEGYTVPNATVYPWQWLWDSCFHALVWAALDEPDRALAELRSALADQDELGFVPHIRYRGPGPQPHAAFWGRSASSSITQPPMYGHAVAELARRGVDVPDDVVDRAVAGVRFLLDHRVRDGGLITVVHPWETGCDDSPRWDHWCGPDGWDRRRWYDVKGELLTTVERSSCGSPLANPALAVAPAGFNALVAFNAAELGLRSEADELTGALDDRWDDQVQTWVDGDHPSGHLRTVDALLPVLVSRRWRTEALGQLDDPAGFGGRFGPPAVHRAEPCFDPRSYWRGPVWPQLTYLLAVAGAPVGDRLVAGAVASGLAEYWHPDTGEGLGAVPQSWTGLAVCVEPVA